MCSLSRLSALILCTLAFGLAQVHGKSNLSGTWKMDPDKSDFGHGPAPQSRIDRIRHNDPLLKDTITQSNRQGEMTYDMNYTTDGKESTNTVRGNQVRSIAKWEGDDLVIESKVGARAEIKDRWTLSPDGKTITLRRHMTGPMGSTDQTILFEKQ
jgi:hypothetical protein